MFEVRKAKPLREPRRIDPVLCSPVKAPRYQLYAAQGTKAPRQGSRIHLFELMVVRRDAPEEIGKLSDSVEDTAREGRRGGMAGDD